jgi:hypothetical protein
MRTILLVDDDPIILTLTSIHLLVTVWKKQETLKVRLS